MEINDEYGFVMKDNSIDNIYKAIEKVVSNVELKNRGQELCYERVKNEFTWEHTVDNLEKIAKKLNEHRWRSENE